ncbi:ImmA/IrrE family metallo-endopeptidase [Isoptericola sp. F-RaC21]|uniref:ImmA/IrrE family metallo-endopeptidase n=1 Tax=Isoptericola sp. F-RaC21 TaxID=3141452 RepID=UPI00315BF227
MTAEAEAREAASRFRREHRLGVQPLGDLIAIIEQVTGIDVAVLDAGPDEHGLTMRDPHHGMVVIGVARTDKPMRQRSSLAHELGHVTFGDWASIDRGAMSARSPQEVRADAFARHLLVPVDGVRELLGSRTEVGLSSLSAVVQRFLVSPAVASIALCDAGYIDAVAKKEWMALTTPQVAARFGWSDHYRALQADSLQRRAPQRLLERAINGYVAGVLSAQVIATLRGVSVDEVESEFALAGITPSPSQVAWSSAADLPDVDVDLSDLDEDGGPDRAHG